ncbi:MAG: MFS transporter [Anaerolineae bacterium]|nr:MFS transporter [Anaerolineae bacterium]
MTIFADQINHLRRFSPPVRRLLLFTLFAGTGNAVWSLLFNLYLRQAGFRQDFIGDLNFWMAMASALTAPLAGLLSNRLGQRTMLLTGAALHAVGQLISVWFVQSIALIAAMAVIGIAFPLWIVSYNPFMAVHSRPDERVPLFSVVNTIWLATAMAGSIAGGWLPGLLAGLGLAAEAQSVAAYRLAATAGTLLFLPALACLLALPRAAALPQPIALGGDKPGNASLRPALGAVAILTGVSALLGLGFGSYFPFINLYFREGLDASPGLVGLIMGAGQAAGVVGLQFAPSLARRFGQVRAAAIAQALSMPCLAGMALAGPLWVGVAFYLGRYAIWNTGSASFDAFQMEAVPDRLRATLNSLAGIPSGVGFNLAWALGGALGGRLIVAHGYPAIFFAAIAFTLPGTALYLLRFRRASPPAGGAH